MHKLVCTYVCSKIRFPKAEGHFNSSCNFYRLLISFANSLDPDQEQQYVGPDLDPNCLTQIVFMKEFYEKVNFEKKASRQLKHEKLPSMQSIN